MINSIRIQAHDEHVAPPETLLEVAQVGDVIFLSIGSYEEDYESSTFTAEAQIGVKGVDFIAALTALMDSVEADA